MKFPKDAEIKSKSLEKKPEKLFWNDGETHSLSTYIRVHTHVRAGG
jgi:hypothetical protein